jgi:hypothetical protein
MLPLISFLWGACWLKNTTVEFSRISSEDVIIILNIQINYINKEEKGV